MDTITRKPDQLSFIKTLFYDYLNRGIIKNRADRALTLINDWRHLLFERLLKFDKNDNTCFNLQSLQLSEPRTMVSTEAYLRSLTVEFGP